MSTSAQTLLAPWLQRQLQALLSQRGHARLLQGPSGLGQYELGLALAQAWLCEAPTATGACGVCGSCHLVDTRAHPDFVALMPETTALEFGWPLSEKAQKDIDDKKRKPSKEIRVEAMRDTVGFAQRTSARGRGMAVLVYPAERMNHVTANALLKTLEEPPGDTRFVLASEATHQLLPTIRSRCQTHAMVWPDAAEALAWLQPARGSLVSHRRTGAGLAAGRRRASCRCAVLGPGRAWMPRPGPTCPRRWPGATGAVSRPGRRPSNSLCLQKLCHDLMASAAGATPRFFPGPRAAAGTPLARPEPLVARTLRRCPHRGTPFFGGPHARSLGRTHPPGFGAGCVLRERNCRPLLPLLSRAAAAVSR